MAVEEKASERFRQKEPDRVKAKLKNRSGAPLRVHRPLKAIAFHIGREAAYSTSVLEQKELGFRSGKDRSLRDETKCDRYGPYGLLIPYFA